MTDDVGSLKDEFAALLETLGGLSAEGEPADPQSHETRAHQTPSQDAHSQDTHGHGPQTAERQPHTCPHGWCPVCRVVEVVQDHPEAAAAVVTAGVAFAHSIREALDAILNPVDQAGHRTDADGPGDG